MQAQQLGHLGPQHHPVADLQLHPLQVAPQRQIAADHVDQPHALAPEQLHAQDLAPDQVAFGGDHRLGEKLHLRLVAEQVGHADPVGQKPRGDEPQIDHPVGNQRQPQRGHLENAERRLPMGAGHTVDQQVRRGADQRQRAAQYRGIAERDQQLACRYVQGAGNLDEDRDHHHDHRRVRHPRRSHQHKAHQQRHGKARPRGGLGLGQAGKGVQRAGPHQGAHDDEHRRDGPGRRVRQNRQRRIIGQHTRDQHHRHPADGHHLGREGLAQEHHEHAHDDDQGEDGFAGLGKQK